MPQRRVSMRHIGEVLRLAAQGLSYHEISRSVGISRTSVHNYLERAQRAGLRWPLPRTWTPPNSRHGCSSATKRPIARDDPSRIGRRAPRAQAWQARHAAIAASGVQAGTPGRLGYTQFCRHYTRWLDRQDVVMRLEYAAGDRMFVDFAGDTMPVSDRRRVRYGTRRSSSACSAPVAICTRRRRAVRTCGVVGRARSGAAVLWRRGPRRRARLCAAAHNRAFCGRPDYVAGASMRGRPEAESSVGG